MPNDLRVELDGTRGDLHVAAECFRDFDPRVVKLEDVYCLVSREFEGMTDPSELHLRAKPLLAAVNMSMRMHDTSQEGLSLAGVSYINEAGARVRIRYLEGTSSLRIRARATARGEVEGDKPRPSNAQRYVKLAAVNPAAMEVLRYWNVDPRDGHWLYKVYEVIRDDLGGKDAIAKAGLASAVDLGRFTGSVNRPDVLGDFARHARMPGPPPRDQMDEADATSFTQTLAINWLLYRYEAAVADGTIKE